jgi:hypothetical protein
VSASERAYDVQLYRCRRPLPLNSVGIGRGTCGGLAALYGGFGGRA